MTDVQKAAARKRYEDPDQRSAARAQRARQMKDPKKRARWLRAMKLRRGKLKEGAVSRRPEYRVWDAMNARCYRPKTKYFENYGGRGIRVCAAWRGRGGFQKFFEHVGARPSKDHQIDRRNNDGHYEPGNVRWATRIEQGGNTRKNAIVIFRGKRLYTAELARRLNIEPGVLAYRIRTWPESRWDEPVSPRGKFPRT